jgi:hypothetical protein
MIDRVGDHAMKLHLPRFQVVRIGAYKSALLPAILLMIPVAAGSAPIANAATISTTIQLSIPVPSVALGVPTSLVATVTDASHNPVLLGAVTFYDGSRVLGTVQIVSGAGGSFAQGTANFKTASFAPGANSITAVFAGTKIYSASTSPATTVTVTGKTATSIVLSDSLVAGEDSLTAVLQAFGVPEPTGSIDFLDAITDATLETAPLDGAAWKSKFVISSMPEVGGEPGGVVAGDFNGDGLLDLATGNNEGGISVLIGKGDGTFESQVSYGAGGFPANIYTGDFNNDGKLDLAIVNYFDGAVGILLGKGDGTFQPQIDYGSVNGAVDAKIADFNGDGNLDFVITDRYGNDVAVLLGNGDGTFQPQQTYATGSGPWSPVVGDLNGDGIPDLLVSAGGQVSELLGKGDGTFNPMTVLSLGPSGNGPYMTIGDLNGDGKLDVVLGNNQLNTVSVSLGNGNGTFQTTQIYPVGSAPGQPVIIDVNQDGIPDIAVTSQNDNNIEVLLGKGDGTFQDASIYLATSESPNFMIEGDFNGDGRPDLDATTSNGDAETVILNAQTATVVVPQIAPPASGMAQIEARYPGDGIFASSNSNIVATSPPPEVTSVSANYGALYAIETLIGANFGASQGSSSVTFNGVSAPVSSWSNSSITLTVPYRATTGNIVVTVGGQASSGVPFTVEPAPSVSGISPASGPVGAHVIISGQNLLDAEGHGSVWLNAQSFPILSQSNTSIEVEVPEGATSGVFDVHVNGVGISTPVFTVPGAPAKPHLSSLSANYGALYAIMTLTGSGFGAVQGSSTVTFDGIAAPTCCWGNNSITVSVPYRSASGNVVVTVAGQPSNGIPFTLEPTPTVTGVSPNSGLVGTLIVISGDNLVDAQGHGSIWFGNVNAPIVSQSSTSIQVRVPAGATTGPIDAHINGVGNYTPVFTVTN